MPYLRLLLAWIIMVAVPLQGFAAASMLFCGTGAAHHSQAASHAHPADVPAHDHAQQEPDSKVVADQGSAKASDDGNATQLTHKCGVCASCCHAVAITQAPQLHLPEGPAQADRAAPLRTASSRPSVVPDKPPRA
jgi:hypothetical protein